MSQSADKNSLGENQEEPKKSKLDLAEWVLSRKQGGYDNRVGGAVHAAKIKRFFHEI